MLDNGGATSLHFMVLKTPRQEISVRSGYCDSKESSKLFQYMKVGLQTFWRNDVSTIPMFCYTLHIVGL